MHFTEEYLTKRKIYFEPFNIYILDIIQKRRNFALTRIPEKDKLLIRDNIFVIKKDVLKQ